MSCLNCNSKKKCILCKHCRIATYCGKECFFKHWDKNHQYECVGLDTKTKKTFQKKPTYMEEKPFNFNNLAKDMSNVPNPTESELTKMMEYAKLMSTNDTDYVVNLAKMYQKRASMYEQDTIYMYLTKFLKTNFQSSDKKIKKIIESFDQYLKELHLSALSGEFDGGKSQDWIDNAVILIFEEANQDVIPYFQKDDSQSGFDPFFDFSINMTTGLTENLYSVYPLYRYDELTVAMGFEINDFFEGTEDEVKEKLKTNKPDWWDNRFDYFSYRMGYLENKPKFSVIEEIDNTMLLPKMTENIPLDYRCRLQLIFLLFDEILLNFDTYQGTDENINTYFNISGKGDNDDNAKKTFFTKFMHYLSKGFEIGTTFVLTVSIIWSVAKIGRVVTELDYDKLQEAEESYEQAVKNQFVVEKNLNKLNIDIADIKKFNDDKMKIFTKLLKSNKVNQITFAEISKGLDSFTYPSDQCLNLEHYDNSNFAVSLSMGELGIEKLLQVAIERTKNIDCTERPVLCDDLTMLTNLYKKLTENLDPGIKYTNLMDFIQTKSDFFQTLHTGFNDQTKGNITVVEVQNGYANLMDVIKLLEKKLPDPETMFLNLKKLRRVQVDNTILLKRDIPFLIQKTTQSLEQETVADVITNSILDSSKFKTLNTYLRHTLKGLGFAQELARRLYRNKKEIEIFHKNILERTPGIYEWATKSNSYISENGIYLMGNPWLMLGVLEILARLEIRIENRMTSFDVYEKMESLRARGKLENQERFFFKPRNLLLKIADVEKAHTPWKYAFGKKLHLTVKTARIAFLYGRYTCMAAIAMDYAWKFKSVAFGGKEVLQLLTHGAIGLFPNFVKTEGLPGEILGITARALYYSGSSMWLAGSLCDTAVSCYSTLCTTGWAVGYRTLIGKTKFIKFHEKDHNRRLYEKTGTTNIVTRKFRWYQLLQTFFLFMAFFLIFTQGTLKHYNVIKKNIEKEKEKKNKK
jgi:hypothetical protein